MPRSDVGPSEMCTSLLAGLLQLLRAVGHRCDAPSIPIAVRVSTHRCTRRPRRASSVAESAPVNAPNERWVLLFYGRGGPRPPLRSHQCLCFSAFHIHSMLKQIIGEPRERLLPEVTRTRLTPRFRAFNRVRATDLCARDHSLLLEVRVHVIDSIGYHFVPHLFTSFTHRWY
jgi:hypothetical protein